MKYDICLIFVGLHVDGRYGMIWQDKNIIGEEMITGLIALGATVIDGVTGWMKGKQEITKASQENKARMLRDAQNHNQSWEMKSLENAGWKDDVLFYAFIAMFVWAGFDPEGAGQFFENVNKMPDWFIKTWLWLVASVVGVKKIGDYAPSMINGIKAALKK